MTCIAAIAKNGKVWMGSDSLASARDWRSTIRKDPKIFKVGNMLIGFTSSYRMGQLLGYKLTVPKHHAGVSVEEYMHREFIDSVRKTLKDGGYTRIESNEETGGFFLVGYQGRIFQIECDFQIGEAADQYDAVGCGGQIALGSLFSTEKTKMSPEDRISLAINAAERHSAGVRGPVIIESLVNEEAFENV